MTAVASPKRSAVWSSRRPSVVLGYCSVRGIPARSRVSTHGGTLRTASGCASAAIRPPAPAGGPGVCRGGGNPARPGGPPPGRPLATAPGRRGGGNPPAGAGGNRRAVRRRNLRRRRGVLVALPPTPYSLDRPDHGLDLTT